MYTILKSARTYICIVRQDWTNETRRTSCCIELISRFTVTVVMSLQTSAGFMLYSKLVNTESEITVYTFST